MTDAIENLAEVIAGDRAVEHEVIFPSDRELAQAILAAIQADLLAYVKPKPLEWSEKESIKPEPNTSDRGGWWVSSGNYYFKYSRNTWRDNVLQYRGSIIAYPTTLEAAQAAAYDDLCNRVKALF